MEMIREQYTERRCEIPFSLIYPSELTSRPTRCNTSCRICSRIRRRLLANSMSSFRGSVSFAGSNPRMKLPHNKYRADTDRTIQSVSADGRWLQRPHSWRCRRGPITSYSAHPECPAGHIVSGREKPPSGSYLLLIAITRTCTRPCCPYLCCGDIQSSAPAHPPAPYHCERRTSSNPGRICIYWSAAQSPYKRVISLIWGGISCTSLRNRFFE